MIADPKCLSDWRSAAGAATTVDTSLYSIHIGGLGGSVVSVAGYKLDVSKYCSLFEQFHCVI